MKKVLLLLVLSWQALSCQVIKERQNEIADSPIKLIVTNYYLSERALNLALPYLHPGSKSIDSLRYSYVEYYKNNMSFKQEYYDGAGMLYETIHKKYDENKRILDKLVISEWTQERDSTRISYNYKDSLKYKVETNIIRKNNKATDVIKIKYKYISEKERYVTTWENGLLISEQHIFYPNEDEKRIIEIDKIRNLENDITFRYNKNDEIIYEKWFVTDKEEQGKFYEEYEYVYKYDQKNNWIERTKQSIEKEGKRPKISEKLTRKIYY